MAAASPITQLLCSKVAEQKEKEVRQDIWENSKWKDLATLESNNVGEVGEQFLLGLCKMAGVEAEIDGTTTKQIGGGAGDGIIKGKSVEVKTARQGASKAATFQHELGEVPWHADYMAFIDISPQNFFLTIFPNLTEEEYKSGNKLTPYFPTKKVTWRKQKGAFKFDTSVNLNTTQATVSNAHTLIWTQDTSIETIKNFIDRIIQ
jgi:hypothetical protein